MGADRAGGGHAGAAGVKLEQKNLYRFREQMNHYYRSLHLENQENYFKTTAELEATNLQDISLELLEDLKTGIVSPIDLDEETELKFIVFMKEHIRNSMEEIENMNKQIQKTEKETAQILEETSKMNFQNK